MKHRANPNHLIRLSLPATLAISIMALATQASVAQEIDHSTHAMHQQMHNHESTMNAGKEDHSQHMKAMMSAGSQDYRRSVTHYTLPELNLVDMHGKSVDLDEVLNTDQPLMVNFIYTSCTTICPIMSATFSHAQRQMGETSKPVKWVSISIDPEYDTPARLRDYAKRFHAGSNWQFITGDVDRIITLQKALGVYYGSKMNHKPVTLLRAGRDQPWVRLDGFTSGAELVAEYHQIAHK